MAFLRPLKTVHVYKHSHLPEAQPGTAPASSPWDALSCWASAHLTSAHLASAHLTSCHSLSGFTQTHSSHVLWKIHFFPILWILAEVILSSWNILSPLLSFWDCPNATFTGQFWQTASHVTWLPATLMAPDPLPSEHSHFVSMYLLHDYGCNVHCHHDTIGLEGPCLFSSPFNLSSHERSHSHLLNKWMIIFSKQVLIIKLHFTLDKILIIKLHLILHITIVIFKPVNTLNNYFKLLINVAKNTHFHFINF